MSLVVVGCIYATVCPSFQVYYFIKLFTAAIKMIHNLKGQMGKDRQEGYFCVQQYKSCICGCAGFHMHMKKYVLEMFWFLPPILFYLYLSSPNSVPLLTTKCL